MSVPAEQYELLEKVLGEFSRAVTNQGIAQIADKYRAEILGCCETVRKAAFEAKAEAMQRVKK